MINEKVNKLSKNSSDKLKFIRREVDGDKKAKKFNDNKSMESSLNNHLSHFIVKL